MNKQWTVMILLGIILIGFIVSLGMVYVLNWESDAIIGNGNVVSQERSLEGFDTVVLDGVGEVNIHPGESFKVVVTTDSNLQDKITTKVEGKTLYIDEKGNFNGSEAFNMKNLTIDVYMPELKNVSLKGAGDIEISQGKGTDLEISNDGFGNINAEKYQVENVNVTLSGAGDITLWATKTFNGKLSGTGNINALKGSVQTANIVLSGAGDISVWVNDALKGELSGVGNILYKGNPSIKDVNVKGLGSITRTN